MYTHYAYTGLVGLSRSTLRVVKVGLMVKRGFRGRCFCKRIKSALLEFRGLKHAVVLRRYYYDSNSNRPILTLNNIHDN